MVASSRRRVRSLGVLGACAVSLAAGVGLVFRLVTPQSITSLGTPELLGMLALLVLPVCVFAAMRVHRRESPVADSGMITSAGERAAPSAHTDARRIVVIGPDVRDRSAERHRRRVAVSKR